MAAGGYLPFVLYSCPVLNTAAPVVQTAGGCICEPMYKGPSRDPCIGSIYPTLLEFGVIQAIILSIKYKFGGTPASFMFFRERLVNLV